MCLVYALDSEPSMTRLQTYWMPFIRRSVDGKLKPVLLIGNKVLACMHARETAQGCRLCRMPPRSPVETLGKLGKWGILQKTGDSQRLGTCSPMRRSSKALPERRGLSSSSTR